MRSSGRVARLTVALAIGLGPAACSAVPGASPTPPQSTAGPPSAATPGWLAPSPRLPPGSLAQWQEVPPPGGLPDEALGSVTWGGDRFFNLWCVVSEERCVQPGIWESEDGLAWRSAGPVFLPPDSEWAGIAAVASSRIGTFAAGIVAPGNREQASIWVREGGGWVPVTPPAAVGAAVDALLATDGRLIAVGSGFETGGFRAWWSADGRTWQAAPSLPEGAGAHPTNLLPVEGALLAWGPSCIEDCAVTTAWWISVDGSAWQPIDPPRGLEGAAIDVIDRTAEGFVAFGHFGGFDLPVRPAAWVADATAADWRQVETPSSSGETTVTGHLAIGRGGVATGRASVGETWAAFLWLKGPGESRWREPATLDNVQIVALLHPQQPNRVIVIGSDGELRAHTWTGLVDWAP